jgi:plasmid replication initiation protein
MNKIIVKKPEEIVKMRCGFSESALKLSAYVISILKENVYEYDINIRDYLKRFDKEIGNFDKLYQTAKEIATETIEFIDREKKEFSIYTIFYSPIYKNGVLKVKIDKDFHTYLLKIKNKYLKYNLENVMRLNSKYAIRLYEILKNELEMRKRQKRELEFRFDLDEMRKLLSIPNSYRYPDIKRQILEKSKSEFKKTDVNFEYEPIKEGRKVVSISFKLIDKSKPKLQSQTGVKHKKDDFKTWRKEILEKKDVILKIDNQIFEIQDGLLARDGKILDKQEAWKAWKFLFKNKDKISLLNRNELKEEVKEDTKSKILNTFKDKLFKAIPLNINGQMQYVNANLIDIRDFKDIDDFTAIFRSGKKMFEMKMSVNRLNNFLK